MLELEIGRDARLQAQLAQLQQDKTRLQVRSSAEDGCHQPGLFWSAKLHNSSNAKVRGSFSACTTARTPSLAGKTVPLLLSPQAEHEAIVAEDDAEMERLQSNIGALMLIGCTAARHLERARLVSM